MNVELPDYSRSLPPGVKSTGEDGVYHVKSSSRPDKWWRVDVTLLQCDCERATKGVSRRSAIRNGGCPAYGAMCEHLKKALVFDGVAMREFKRRER